MNQSEFYEEDVEGVEDGSEADEDTTTNIASLWGIPKQYIILGGAAVIILIIGLIVFAVRKNGKSEEPVDGNYVISATDATVPVSSEQQVQMATITECYVNGTCVGSIIGTPGPGAIISGSDGSMYGILQQTGDTAVMDKMNNVIGYVNLSTSSTSGTASAGTQDATIGTQDDSIELLRKYGYTGDEIELALETGASVDDMIAHSQALRDAVAEESLKRMSDTASEEFQTLIRTTQYCMPLQEFQTADWNSEGYVNQEGSYIVNADYEKIPTYGFQLRVKVKIANGTYAFMDILPSRYAKMPDTGNIVVNVKYLLYGSSAETVQFYITSLTECDVTTLTVNPEDSAVDLNEVIN